jgi:large subunit ribosomal protein L21
MYAIIQTGGKQYRVQPGDRLKVEKLPGEPGTAIQLEQVLAVGSDQGITLGTPTVEGARVSATILRTARDRKIIVFKKKRRQGYHKKQGHRQWFTLLAVNAIETSAPVVEMDQAVDTIQDQPPDA